MLLTLSATVVNFGRNGTIRVEKLDLQKVFFWVVAGELAQTPSGLIKPS